MASLTIRNLDSDLKRRLQARAASHGHSVEEELCEILRTALSSEEPPPERCDLVTSIRRRLAPLEGVDLEIPPREPARPPPDLGR
ncbi:MAG TPA: plasmid stabilization protein [Chromatiales bacterium]|nr:plasmid stabilization protein [Chromatiales bacterium]